MSIDNNKRFLFSSSSFLYFLLSFLPSFLREKSRLFTRDFCNERKKNARTYSECIRHCQRSARKRREQGKENKKEGRSVNIHGRVSNGMKIETTSSPPLHQARGASSPFLRTNYLFTINIWLEESRIEAQFETQARKLARSCIVSSPPPFFATENFLLLEKQLLTRYKFRSLNFANLIPSLLSFFN